MIVPAVYADLVHWVKEREEIRRRKESGDGFPWTDDPILRDYRFCNVRREDDRVTRWINEEIRVPFADHPNLWFMLCLARQINWPATLAALMDDAPDISPADRLYPKAWPDTDWFEPFWLGEALEELAQDGRKVFTGAYIITAPSTKGEKKTRFVAEVTLGELWEARDRLGPAIPRATMQHVWMALTQFKGWGSFLAYQAVVDMRFCPSLLASAPDVTTWAAAGPGTIRGLNRLHGRRVDASLTQDRALADIVPLWYRVREDTGVEMDLSDIPNVLCETDKYIRVKNGEGTPRARYVLGRGS